MLAETSHVWSNEAPWRELLSPRPPPSHFQWDFTPEIKKSGKIITRWSWLTGTWIGPSGICNTEKSIFGGDKSKPAQAPDLQPQPAELHLHELSLSGYRFACWEQTH